jgi:hypothetical protein
LSGYGVGSPLLTPSLSRAKYTPKGLKGFFTGLTGTIGLPFFVRFPEIHPKSSVLIANLS